MMTSEMCEQSDPQWEEVCGPGVHTGWVLSVNDEPQPTQDDTVDTHDFGGVRSHAATLLDVERVIADRIAAHGDHVTRIVHSLGGRDIYLRDGSCTQIRWEPITIDWRCLDCGVDTDAIGEYYMVLDAVWDLATDGVDGHICITCLEHRLGRTLQSSDFSTLGINTDHEMPRSPLLTARLRGEAPTRRKDVGARTGEGETRFDRPQISRNETYPEKGGALIPLR